MSISYAVLYTNQKLKKSKTWQDGKLVLAGSGEKRAVLKDDKGVSLDSLWIPKDFVFEEDAELESDRYCLHRSYFFQTVCFLFCSFFFFDEQ